MIQHFPRKVSLEKSRRVLPALLGGRWTIPPFSAGGPAISFARLGRLSDAALRALRTAPTCRRDPNRRISLTTNLQHGPMSHASSHGSGPDRVRTDGSPKTGCPAYVPCRSRQPVSMSLPAVCERFFSLRSKKDLRGSRWSCGHQSPPSV